MSIEARVVKQARNRSAARFPIIAQSLPQKKPFLFIDRVVAAKRTTADLTCSTRITGKEYFFKGHFPGNPVLPGVIITEAMAQASILLYAFLKPASAARKPNYYLGKVEARFMNAVKPGSNLTLQVHGEKIIESGGIVKATARVGKTSVAEATLMFGVKPKNE